jgi:hypothetical protein
MRNFIFILLFSMKTSRPLNSTIGVIIVALTILGFAYSFLERGGIQYYKDHPLNIVIVALISIVVTMAMLILPRCFPKFLSFLKILALGSLVLTFSAISVMAAYTAASILSGPSVLESFRLIWAAFSLVFGVLSMATWRELHATWIDFKLNRNPSNE